MKCHSCGAENSAHFRYCAVCGLPLDPGIAPKELAAGRFCGLCGRPLQLSDIAAPTKGPAHRVERRQVSILFADLVGFTSQAEGVDPELIREMLDLYFATCRTVIGRHGGTVEKFIGDAVMAVWGAPIAHEDDGPRAVAAALELVDTISTLRTPGGAMLRLRAGITSGLAAVSLDAADQAMVAGDIVNTAARLQTIAEAGSVLVDDATRRLAPLNSYSDLGSRALKGKKVSARVWRVDPSAQSKGSIQDDVPVLVGRDAELERLEVVFEDCLQRGNLRWVDISGPAGVGKRRLLDEFARRLRSRGMVMHVASARYSATGAFAPIADVVRSMAEIHPGDGHDDADNKLRSFTKGLSGTDVAAARQMYAAASVLLELHPSGHPVGRAELVAGWRLIFERLAQRGPLALGFEETQHHPDVLDVINEIVEWSGNLPIFLVTTARTPGTANIDGADDQATAKGRAAVALSVGPLDKAATSRLAEALLPKATPHVIEKIVDRSQGVPLYAIEICRTLTARGVSLEIGDSADPAIAVIEGIPPTLNAVLAARLDTLSASEREIVQFAAVIGQRFRISELSAVASLPPRAVEERLGQLVKKNIIAPSSEEASPSARFYYFAQTLLRDVAYDRLSRRERFIRHVAVARLLDAEDAELFAQTIGMHYLDALDVDDTDASVNAAAVPAIRRAASRLSGQGSPELALRFAERALGLTVDVHRRDELHQEAGEYAYMAGKYAKVSEHFQSIVELTDPIRAHVTERLVAALELTGHSAQGVAIARAAIDKLAPRAQPGEMAAVEMKLATSLRLSGNLAEAVPHAEEALRWAKLAADADMLCAVIAVRADFLHHEGDSDAALRLLHEGLAIAEERGLPRGVVRTRTFMVDVLKHTSRFHDVVREGGLVLRDSRRAGFRTPYNFALASLAYTYFVLGQWDSVVATADELSGDDLGQLWTACQISQTLSLRGEFEAATKLLDRALPLESSEDKEDTVYLDAARARLALVSGDARGGFVYALRALENLELMNFCDAVHEAFVVACESAVQLEDRDGLVRICERVAAAPNTSRSRYLMAWLRCFEGLIAQQKADVAVAEEKLRLAEMAFRQMETPLGLARVLEAQGRTREARDILAALGAKPLMTALTGG